MTSSLIYNAVASYSYKIASFIAIVILTENIATSHLLCGMKSLFSLVHTFQVAEGFPSISTSAM